MVQGRGYLCELYLNLLEYITANRIHREQSLASESSTDLETMTSIPLQTSSYPFPMPW